MMAKVEKRRRESELLPLFLLLCFFVYFLYFYILFSIKKTGVVIL